MGLSRIPQSFTYEHLGRTEPGYTSHKTTHVTFIPRAPQKPSQNDDATRAHDLKRRARDIACDSHGMEDQIRAMVSSYMAPDEDDEDPELMIGRLVC